jgi:hypothetical protein
MVVAVVLVLAAIMGLSLVQVAESSTGIPFLSFLLGGWFLYTKENWIRVVTVVLLSFMMSVLFLVPVSVALLIWAGLLAGLEWGGSVLGSITVRFVLGALLAAGLLAWLAGVEWREEVIIYSLVSVVLGVGIVYRSSLRKFRQTAGVHWSGEHVR